MSLIPSPDLPEEEARLGSELNESQREAVFHAEGPLLVLAGAGSGKTRVITYRIAHLIRFRRIPPWQVLAITFTNKAAEEMRQRVSSLLGGEAQGIWLGTFHSICARLLRRHAERVGRSNRFAIYDAGDTLSQVKRCMAALELNTTLYPPQAVAHRISRAKAQLLTPVKFAAQAPPFGIEQKTALVYQSYTRALAAADAFDFDDLLTATVHLLEEEDEVRHRYQQQFLHILVDEYQDTNHAQYQILRLLAAPPQNLCVVGDDDQSIYRWRGAELGNILNFERDFPGARVVKLEENFRSTQTILSAASALVRLNPDRKPKTLWTRKGIGARIVRTAVADEEEEAAYVSTIIESLRRDQGYSLSDCAVFYRINAQSRALEEALRVRGLPYQVVGSLQFYERREVKDLLAYLRVLVNPRDGVSLRRILNVPPRSLGKMTIERLEALAQEKSLSLWEVLETDVPLEALGGRAASSLRAFRSLIQDLAALAPSEPVPALMRRVIAATGYRDYLRKGGGAEAENRLENLEELIGSARSFASSAEDASLLAYLESKSLISDVDDYQLGRDTVSLMTLHSSKGLEFRAVFLVGMEEGLCPHLRALDSPDELQEERRLCYVGMTRARERLYLVHARQRRLHGVLQRNLPSPFLGDLPAELVEAAELAGWRKEPHPHLHPPGRPVVEPETADGFPVGSLVAHPRWGMGEVTDREGEGEGLKLTVRFDRGVEKKFMKVHAPLRRL